MEWLRRFPALSRAQVREYFAHLVVDELRAEITSPDSVSKKRYDWLVVKTGGSTGVPTTEDGTLQSSVFVRHFVGVSLNRQIIREWQLEQTDRTHFVFRYIAIQNEGLADNLSRLKESFQLVFGRSAVIEMLPVNEIPPSPSGKVRWIINRCQNWK